MKNKAIERECSGYIYTGEADDEREKWQIETDYRFNRIYLTSPMDEDADLIEFEAFARALQKACRDMRQELKTNRFPV